MPAQRVNTFKDYSNDITVSVFRDSSPSSEQRHNGFEVRVADDMVCIGGGATGSDDPGHFLTASEPNDLDTLTGWKISSKDHEIPNPVILKAYAIGMKIDGMSRDQLRGAITVKFSDSAKAPHPKETVSLDYDNYSLLGGGFHVNWEGAGNIATGSFPSSSVSWTAHSKDMDTPDPSTITVYAIGIKNKLQLGTPPNTSNWRVATVYSSQTSSLDNHPWSIAIFPNSMNGFAICGGGAEVHYTNGNYLWSLEPTLDPIITKFTGRSKDHINADVSRITSYLMGIRLEY
jgi:hypothetical protein